MIETFRTLRVPASSANLGPGFDALGLALNVYLECRFRPASQSSIRVTGRDAALIATDDDNLIVQTARHFYNDRIELEIHNGIPLGKGLGSSAAAVVAGVVIGHTLAELHSDRDRVFNEAAKIEGHPDNVGASVYGGIVASAFALNSAIAIRLPFPPAFGVAVIVPEYRVPTPSARRVLPESHSHADVVFNLQRLAILIGALATGERSAFPAALEDRLHQPCRAALVPGLEAVTRLHTAGLLGCALSGAGPSILVLYERGHELVCEKARNVFSKEGGPSEILWTEPDASGYLVS